MEVRRDTSHSWMNSAGSVKRIFLSTSTSTLFWKPSTTSSAVSGMASSSRRDITAIRYWRDTPCLGRKAQTCLDKTAGPSALTPILPSVPTTEISISPSSEKTGLLIFSLHHRLGTNLPCTMSEAPTTIGKPSPWSLVFFLSTFLPCKISQMSARETTLSILLLIHIVFILRQSYC